MLLKSRDFTTGSAISVRVLRVGDMRYVKGCNGQQMTQVEVLIRMIVMGFVGQVRLCLLIEDE